MKKLVQLWFDSSREGVALLKPIRNRRNQTTSFHYLRINERFAQLTGHSADELAGTSPAPVLSFIDPDELNDRLQTILKEGNPWRQDFYQANENRWISLTGIRLTGQLVLTLQEIQKPADSDSSTPVIDGIKRAEAIDNNALLQTVVNSSPVALALLRPIYQDGRIIDFRYLLSNPRNCQITGSSQQVMYEKTLLTLFPHLVTNGIFAKLVDVALTGSPQYFELQDILQHKEVWGNFALIRVEHDVLLSMQDITRLKRVEADLRQTNLALEQRVAERTSEVRQLSALQQAILTHAGLGIVATDTNGIIQLVNPALETLTGYRAEELVGQVTPGFLRLQTSHHQQIEALRVHLDEQSQPMEQVVMDYVQKFGVIRRENLLQTKEGQVIPVLSTVTGLYDEQKTLLGYLDTATDISVLKSAEATAARSQQRTRLAIKAGKMGIWDWNLLTDEVTLDDQVYSYFSLFEKNCVQTIHEVLKLVHREDVALVSQAIRAIKEGQDTIDISFRIFLPGAQTTHLIQVDGLRYQNDRGAVQQMIGIVVDLTARRQAEYAYQESERRYRSLVDNMKEAVFQTDVDGLWIYLNPAWEEITGFSVPESLGTLFLNYVHPDDREHNQQQFEPLISRQKSYCRHEIRYLHNAGGYRWVEVFAQITVDSADVITGTIGTLTDITDRKLADEALRESEQRFRAFAENIDELLWIRDSQDPHFLYMNKAFEQLSGIPLPDLYQNPLAFLSVIPEEDRPILLNAFRTPETGSQFPFRARHQDGSMRWFNARLFGNQQESGAHTRRIGVATDMTMIIEREQILAESLEKERTLNMLKSQFISIASHQFRTPLASILSSVDLIRYYADKNTAPPTTGNPVRKQADLIYQQIISLEELIGDTLTLSKLEEGKIQVQMIESDLVAFTRETVNFSFGNREDKREVRLLVSGKPMPVRIDPKLLGHALINLLSNAFKFSTMNPELTVRFTHKTAHIAIRDRGIGIPARDLPNLFGKFFRASNVGQIKGTGLGLAICQEYIRLQKGIIEVDSQEGVGTIFTITLPIDTTES